MNNLTTLLEMHVPLVNKTFFQMIYQPILNSKEIYGTRIVFLYSK